MNSADSNSPDNNPWPALAYADWQDTCGTLHLWTQVIGKVKLALSPLSNHWWGIVLFVTARVAGISFERVTRATLPFLWPLLAVLMAITLWPALTTALPHAMR